MARVVYDGCKIIVDAARLNVDKLNDLAEKFNAEYLPALNAFAFNRTINSVLEIAKIENAIFDESFLNLKSKIDKAVQKKQDEIAALNLPECMYPFQKETVWQMLKMTGNILLASDMGCIDGEAIVRVRRCETTKQMKLKDLYTRFHSKRLEEKYTLKEQPIYIRGFDGTYYKQNEIIDVLDKGEKECIKLILESGKEIILTPDHVVFTKEGEIKSEDSLNKFIMVENKHHKKEPPKVCKICGSTENIIHRRGAVYFGYCHDCMKKNKKEHGAYVDDYKEVIDRDGYVVLQGKMFSDYKGKKSRNGIPKHRYVMEQYLGRLLRSDEVVHHIDRNKLNNDISNLQLVTKEEHMRIHQELETWYAAFHCVPSYEKVINIENVGKRHVYDVKVKDHHNFLANDILVHNCGKSCMTIEYLACAAKHIECYPVVVVCPASLKTNWAVEFKKWNTSVTTYVVNGRTSYEDLYVLNSAKQADVVIINYDILGIDDKEAQKREKERIKVAKEKGYRYRKAFIPISGWVDYINKEIKPAVLVCDECQAIESSKTVRTRGVTQIAVNENVQKIMLSGTPFDTRVAQFYNVCHLLAPDLFPKEWDFKQRYCAPHYNGFGWEYKGASNIPELREKLSGIMIRHIKEEVLSQLPEKQKIPIYFDMDKNSRKVYDSMEMELAEQEEGIHQFAYLAKMREALVDIKLEAVIQFIKDMLEVEDKLVVFTFHNRMYDELMKVFGKQAVGINGSVPSEKRQEMVDAFQKDENVKIFVGQTQAASTGITLTASHTVIFTEWASTISQMEQATDRIHRIGQKAERCLIYYLIVKDTVDEDPYYNLSEHYADMKAVMDGNTEATFLDINESMIARVKQRKLMKNKKGVQIEYE